VYVQVTIFAARLDEILVHAGNNQLPQDLEERSAQGSEFHIHTAQHGDSRLDHGTLTADLPVALLLRPMRAHSSRRDIVDREKWDLMNDSWRAHVKKSSYPQAPGSIRAKNTSTQIHMDLSK